MNKGVYVGVKGSVVAYDKSTGEELWRTHLKGANFVSICVDDDVIIAHTGGHLFGLNKIDGNQIWDYETESIILSSPAVADGKVYFGLNSGEFLCLDFADGDFNWN